MTILLRQSAAHTFELGPFIDDTDGKTAEAALTIAAASVFISKAGGALAAKNDATALTGTGDSLGYYACPLNATDTNTLGGLRVHVHVAGALPVFQDFQIVPAVVYDSLVAGSDVLHADVTQWLGTAAATPTVAGVPEVDVTHWIGTAAATPTTAGVPEVDVTHWSGTAVAAVDAAGYPKVTVKSGTGTGELSLAGGAIKVQAGIRKNQALANFPFLMTDSTNHNPATGLTVTGTRSIDGAAFGAGTIANMTEVANGVYQCDLGAGDLNGDTICLRFTATGADDLVVTLVTEP